MAFGSIMSQKPNVYTDDEVLTDETKAIYGLGPEAVPDDVFKELGIHGLKYKIIQEESLESNQLEKIIDIQTNSLDLHKLHYIFIKIYQNEKEPRNSSFHLIFTKGNLGTDTNLSGGLYNINFSQSYIIPLYMVKTNPLNGFDSYIYSCTKIDSDGVPKFSGNKLSVNKNFDGHLCMKLTKVTIPQNKIVFTLLEEI